MEQLDGFWAGGQTEQLAAIDAAEARELAALEEALETASPEAREGIEQGIDRVRQTYAQERCGLDESLFLKLGVERKGS